MFTDEGNVRCDNPTCQQLMPDIMLWIEVNGTYKFRGVYKTFTWHFCDLHCLKKKLESIDWDGMDIAKHKERRK